MGRTRRLPAPPFRRMWSAGGNACSFSKARHARHDGRALRSANQKSMVRTPQDGAGGAAAPPPKCQPVPCRQGTGWLERILERVENGEGRQGDIDLLISVADNIEGNTICALGEAAAWPVQSFVKKFRHEFVAHVEAGKCVVETPA